MTMILKPPRPADLSLLPDKPAGGELLPPGRPGFFEAEAPREARRQPVARSTATTPCSRRRPAGGSCDGVALIIVLGLLSVLTILALAFSKAMRDERMTARLVVNQARAGQLVHVALIRALDDVDESMTGACYPLWTTNHFDVLCPDSGVPCTNINLLAGSVLHLIPPALWHDAESAATNACWINVATNFGGGMIGRITYLVVNCSGLIDANDLAPPTDSWRSRLIDALVEIDELSIRSNFLDQADAHVRFETVGELRRINATSTPPPRILFPYSFDPDPKQVVTNQADLGFRDITLTSKFNVETLRNYADSDSFSCDAYANDGDFRTNYWTPLTNLLVQARLTNSAAPMGGDLEWATNVAWNLINYLDANRVPQSDAACPWREDGASEAVPLINEIVLQECSGTTNHYEFVVELWFPFYPAVVVPGDGFELQVGVFSQFVDSVSETDIMDRAETNWLFTTTVTNMRYGTSTEFLCITSPADYQITFPEVVTNGESTTTNFLPLAEERPVWFLARVLYQGTAIVDEAMGYASNDNERALMKFTDTAAYSVNDPRMNGYTSRWTRTAGMNTLGAMNANCVPTNNHGHGLPIHHPEASGMDSIAELGNIFINEPWHNLDLMHYTRGAALLDWMTIDDGRAPDRGRISISTGQRDVLEAMFGAVRLGTTAPSCPAPVEIFETNIVELATVLTNEGPYNCFRDLFWPPTTNDHPVTEAFRACATAATNGWGEVEEQTFREIIDHVTFRQNLFTIVLAVELVGPRQTLLARKRAVAVVYRDAYTGRHFTRLLMRLDE